MSRLLTQIDPRSATFRSNRAHMLARLGELDAVHREALAGGGEVYTARHRRRGKLLARERIELLLDPDAPFLELSAAAGAGSGFTAGAALVTGVGVVAGTECVILANDPTVRGGATNPFGLKKGLRAYQVAFDNRLPLLWLVESGGADLPTQSQIFVPGGATFRDLARLSAAGIPTVALVFGNSTAGGAYLPGLSEYVVMVKESAKVFLGGPPLVKMATGEESNDEELGGAEMHARTSGLAEYLAADEHDALRIGREIVASLGWRKRGPLPEQPSRPPRYPAEDLLGIASADLKVPFPMREVLARILDDSQFFEWKANIGTNLVTGWGHLYGYRLGVLANERGVLFSEESQKAAQFIQLANVRSVPLLFVQNVTGYMVGKRYEQGGIIKHGAAMINAVSNSKVPHLTLVIGGSYGAGNYGMCGRAYEPRFLFLWPNAKTAVMGAEQLAGTLSIVAREAARSIGRAFDEEADAKRRAETHAQIERESSAVFHSAQLYDDGVIDPRDSRAVLGIALSAAHGAEVAGSRTFGVFRL